MNHSKWLEMFSHVYFASIAANLSRRLFRSSSLFMCRVYRAFYCQHGGANGTQHTVSATVAASSGNKVPKLELAASGAAEPVATQILSPASPGPVSITQLLEMNTGQGLSTDAYLSRWAAQMKAYVDVQLVSSCDGSRTWDAKASVRVIQHSIESFRRELSF